MKKAFITVLAGIVCLLLSACGSDRTTYEPELYAAIDNDDVIAGIDEITERVHKGELTEEEGIAELREWIPRPDDFPRRNIEYIIPWGEGGGSDLYARQISRDAEKILGVTLVPNNMPGGNGEVALAYALSQPADGYTIYGAITSQVINDTLGEQPYSFIDDTTFIIRNQGPTEVFWTRSDGPYQTWEDLIEADRENPGSVTFTGAGALADDELRIMEMNNQLGTSFTYIPSNASGERVSSVLGGHIDVLHETTGAVIDLYRAGQIRPLLVPSDEPFVGIDAPTTAELGIDISIGRWRGMNAPGHLDPEITVYLHNVFYAAANLPHYRQFEEDSYFHMVDGYLDYEDYRAHAEEERETIVQLLRDLGYME
ncbi:tripartite tricarboxylate transporter substrate binding protein [Alkalihalobacillus oceani]|uniref:tripartite tricarboxylate transporter substrate binding protein n=1 Tax=Halalkalibacter oceani TaxID=1653776 RepID=UPI00203ED371|nr:tripartite tricarboxylate transporter substrate binding protein [Halalkalibacter oceani]MCM3760113.1 tripartite tricarboxylate transporter substrate binding protein [Halalkalibacter oceani]